MTPHFSDVELACHCGCGMLPDENFMQKIEELREVCGFPFTVTSAARCPRYNAAKSETGFDGPHTTGRAIDIAITGPNAFILVHTALNNGFTGIGISQKSGVRFIHLDDLPNSPRTPRPRLWSY